MADGRWRMTSILVAQKGRTRVYSPAGELPPKLRATMDKALQSDLSATILIADSQGRREITRLFKEARQARIARAGGAAGRTRFAIDAVALGALALLVWVALTLR